MRSLHVTRRLVDELTAAGITFCHWKSNDRLEEALLGEGDLDLLVAADQQDAFEAIVAGLGFVHLRSQTMKRFPGLTDFLGLDTATGELVHLHVHYRLVLGDKVKNHHLPLERWLLARTRTIEGVPVPRVEDELFLLYVRAVLKSDARACVRAWLRRTGPLPPSTVRELEWLAHQTDDATVINACRSAGLSNLAGGLAAFLQRFRSGSISPGHMFREKPALVRHLRGHQRYPTVVCLVRRAWYGVLYSRAARRVRPIPGKRLYGPGLYVALAGADGCGKTSLGHDLPRWLNWKLESSTVYLGQPKGSAVITGLRRVRKLARKTATLAAGRGFPLLERVLSRPAAAAETALWLYIARGRVRRDRTARRRAGRGEVVFAERFPLPEFWSMEVPMDGPRLALGTTDKARSGWLARLERRLYQRIRRPDVVLVLAASVDTLHARKPETPLDELRAKVRAVDELVALGHDEVLDAARPYEEVLLDAKRRVWYRLTDSNTSAASSEGTLPHSG